MLQQGTHKTYPCFCTMLCPQKHTLHRGVFDGVETWVAEKAFRWMTAQSADLETQIKGQKIG